MLLHLWMQYTRRLQRAVWTGLRTFCLHDARIAVAPGVAVVTVWQGRAPDGLSAGRGQ